MLVDKYIDQVAVVADQRKFVSALIVPEFRLVEKWADDHGVKYDSRESLCNNPEVKKMIVNCLIKRVEVYRDYKLHIDFNIDFEQFSMGMDIVAIAA